MVAVRAILFLVCCLLGGIGVADAQTPGAPAVEATRPVAAGLSAKARLRPEGAQGAMVEVELVAALGRAWNAPEVRDLQAAFRIAAADKQPYLPRGEFDAYRQNRKLGIELTFSLADGVKVPLHGYPADTLVLSNIRFYGPGNRTHDAFTGELPFGLRFGDSKAALIARLGPPDSDATDIAPMRWDTARYALFAQLGDDGTLRRLALQVPVVRSDRAGFEER
jgi:hypothetical protein